MLILVTGCQVYGVVGCKRAESAPFGSIDLAAVKVTPDGGAMLDSVCRRFLHERGSASPDVSRDEGCGAEVHLFGPDGYPLDTVTVDAQVAGEYGARWLEEAFRGH
ncbi:hypothetical protein [Streptomyces sp. NPDC001137]|uniref:hypothetical protein n=1 Tax=Streptomyces sp. NPDC001137 TaxID=3154378 RepID=UPI003329B4B5